MHEKSLPPLIHGVDSLMVRDHIEHQGKISLAPGAKNLVIRGVGNMLNREFERYFFVQVNQIVRVYRKGAQIQISPIFPPQDSTLVNAQALQVLMKG